MSKFVPDGPIRREEISNLEQSNAILVERIIKLEDKIRLLEEIIEKDKKDIEEMKKFFSDNVRSRNMIIRAYTKSGLVSKFMPD
jgi:CRISPR/Cas system CMR subunit Cmr6 (Cas7 group RAMP superfamily)